MLHFPAGSSSSFGELWGTMSDDGGWSSRVVVLLLLQVGTFN